MGAEAVSERCPKAPKPTHHPPHKQNGPPHGPPKHALRTRAPRQASRNLRPAVAVLLHQARQLAVLVLPS